MRAFTTVTGPAASLPRPNLDTDVIIRIERLTSLGRDQLGPYALEALRRRPDGSEDPDFILNTERFRTAPILIAGANFGCGSSREGAVWALLATGISCVIAESFGDIFYNNCFQNGLLPVVLPADSVARLADVSTDGRPFTVDLTACRITPPAGAPVGFTIDAQRRDALLDGLDDISRTLTRAAEIDAWQARDRASRPWIWEIAT